MFSSKDREHTSGCEDERNLYKRGDTYYGSF